MSSVLLLRMLGQPLKEQREVLRILSVPHHGPCVNVIVNVSGWWLGP